MEGREPGDGLRGNLLSFCLLFATFPMPIFPSMALFKPSDSLFISWAVATSPITSPKIDIEGQGFQQQEVQEHRRDRLCHWSRLAFEFLVSSVMYF